MARGLGGIVAVALAIASAAGAEAPSGRWWPVQALPKAVVCATDYDQYPDLPSASGRIIPGINGPFHMLVQSVAGLAAQAVNDGRCEEMVWVNTGKNADYRDWYERMVGQGRVEVRGTFAPWDLVERFVALGVVKGYLLYAYDLSEGPVTSQRENMDVSVNVATSLAGIMGGVLVSEELEPRARALGLERLFDARGKTPQWCFDAHRDRLNRRMACFQDPKVPHCRDLAIAQKEIVLFGSDEPAESVMAWLEPLSPILGWAGGDEFKTTLLSTEYGHFQTATNWCLNLPILMAGSDRLTPRRVRSFDPARIDWGDVRSATAFVMSDGDNVQWYMGGFFRAQDGWWNSPDRGRFPMGWSCPFAQLAQLCPEAVAYAADTQSVRCGMVEWGGGYYYPDKFAAKRPNRRELLAEQARRTWANMQATGTNVIGFNVTDLDSPEALETYEVLAREMEGLLGILAFQYAPYEGGEGRVFWAKDRRGIETPVVCARYSIWENTDRPLSGTPAKIARLLDERAAAGKAAGELSYDWTVVHCWSYFKKAASNGDHDEDMAQPDASTQGGIRGLTPVGWCADRLSDNVKVVGPEELMWRIRMKHAPEQTKELIGVRRNANQ